jgi:hypothetical protein
MKTFPARTVTSKIDLHVTNRDGSAFAVKTEDGQYFLVLEADTYHNPPQFEGFGSTEHAQISEAAFKALAKLT